MNEIIIYSSEHCSYCARAKRLLDEKGLAYQEIRVDLDPSKRDEMIEKTNRQTVPQIFINGQPIGGFDDLYDMNKTGKLDKLLRG